MAHEDFREMLASHALTALDREEERAVEAHVSVCAECQAEMDEWRATAAALALVTNPVEPSRQLRARILQSVSAETGARQVGKSKEDSNDWQPAESNVILKLQPPRRLWTTFEKLGAVAAVLALVALVSSLIILWKQNSAAKARLAQVSREVEETRQKLEREREAVALLTTPGTRVAALSGSRDAPHAHATLAYDGNGRAILLAEGLPPAPAGKAYQLWFITGGHAIPGKVFAIDAGGNAILRDQVPAEAIKAAVFAITLEPESGVAAPTGAVYLSGSS